MASIHGIHMKHSLSFSLFVLMFIMQILSGCARQKEASTTAFTFMIKEEDRLGIRFHTGEFGLEGVSPTLGEGNILLATTFKIVSSEGKRMEIYAYALNKNRRWTMLGIKNISLDRPLRIAIEPDENMVLIDSAGSKIPEINNVYFDPAKHQELTYKIEVKPLNP